MSARWYSPAYEADNGNVIICGTQTVVEEYARRDARRLDRMWQDADRASPRVFLAFMDKPDWQRLAVVAEEQQ